MQMKVQKQQSTAHNSKNDTWTTAEYEKNHQNTVGTQNDTTSPRAIRLKPTTSRSVFWWILACSCCVRSLNKNRDVWIEKNIWNLYPQSTRETETYMFFFWGGVDAVHNIWYMICVFNQKKTCMKSSTKINGWPREPTTHFLRSVFAKAEPTKWHDHSETKLGHWDDKMHMKMNMKMKMMMMMMMTIMMTRMRMRMRMMMMMMMNPAVKQQL